MSFGYDGPILENPGPGETPIIVWGYVPSLSFALVGAITFAIVAVGQLFWAIKWKGMYRTFHSLLFVGALVEAGGYGTRVFSHYEPFNIRGFTASWTMVVIAPVFFTAAIDFTLNIIVNAFPGSRGILLLSPKKVLAIFISTDVLSIIVQAAGAALVGISASAQYNGESSALTYDQSNHILTAGLALQVAAWVVFLVFLLIAMWRAHKLPELRGPAYNRMRLLLWVILTTTLLVLLRSCYRLAETSLGFLSGPATNEPLFAGLEYVPVFLAALIWTILPPAKFAPRGDQSMMPDAERKRSDGQDSEASRSSNV